LLFKVSEVMVTGPQLPIVRPDCSLREAVVEMDRCNIGVVVAVIPGKQVAGLLSEGDLRRLILREVSMSTPLAEVMTKTPLVVDENAALGEALAVMEKSGRKVYVLPVVDASGRLVGALRMHDIVGN
jgi:arabinose-5-phosphate isomerase